jgi:ABC-type dipeptide/oligopeptide/nickel transport system permease component/ABC-type transport system substrate-binding protein
MSDLKKSYSPTPFYVYVIGLILGGAFLVLLYSLFSAFVRKGDIPERLSADEELAQVIESRDVTFTEEDLYRITLDIPESEYEAAHAAMENPGDPSVEVPAWFPKNEAPSLKALVESGDLPPVHERVGPEPVVMQGVDGIGTYGGTWLRAATAVRDVVVIAHRMSGSTFVRGSPLGKPIVPHVLKDIEVLEDSSVYILHFRRGLKWSDGHPVTADDLMYWWEHEIHSDALTLSVPPFMRTGTEVAEVTKIDDFTARIAFQRSNPFFISQMTLNSRNMLAPAHYRRQFHPELGDQELIQTILDREGISNARNLYRDVQAFLNPQHPRLWPWIPEKHSNISPYVFIRNPYYYVVDPEGNQLPYIDRLQFKVSSRREMIGVAASEGEITMQQRHLNFSQYTELMSRREESNTKVLLWANEGAGDFAVNINHNRRVDEAQPETAKKAVLLRKKRFKQALSLGINRAPIIRAYFFDITEAVQGGPGPESPFYAPELLNAFVEYDPERANQLLDELWRDMGGDPEVRDDEGFRMFPDGSQMTFYLNFSPFTGVGPLQFVIDDWSRLGVRVVLRERNRTLFYLERNNRDFDMNVWGSGNRFDISGSVATSNSTFFAPGWGTWFDKGGLEGDEAANVPAAVPVPEGHPMRKAMELWREYTFESSLERRQELSAQIAEIAAENLWTINLSSAPPLPVIAKQNLKNIPDLALYSFAYCSPSNTGIETYYLEDEPTDEQTQLIIQEALRNPPALPILAGSADTGLAAKIFAGLLKWGFIGIAVLFIIAIAVKHPFVARRLLLMVPTLIIISVVVFTIIQLPPGDFLTSRIIQLEEAGEDPETAMQDIQNLKEKFHYDEPMWQRYFRWVGAYWFTSFNEEDRGLLQGDMGISMETENSVNDAVGDRMLLTFCVSLLTILFTWAVALPIGIFSAVKQHSIADYAITIFGFLGMCIPPFLLALIFAAAFGVEGLFSGEFETQPYWDWPKVVDLMKHIWVPVVILGVGGTASMIRVMRANLLDELKKPYVTTARAKGKRPVSLLFKYPVRIALNPFISGIGGIFPQLVSGGAIVGMVLTLPTVGPLMLSAIMSQDMNMAGSMLMLLSLLGVFGTLVSDLLLLWVDPRIRMEGGSK